MRHWLLGITFVCMALPVWGDARHTVLMDVLKVRELAAILHAEGLSYGEDLDADFLEGQGGPSWQIQVARIHDADRIADAIRAGLEAHLEDDRLEDTITFFASDLGQQIVMLENSGRAALADDTIEQEARDRYAALAQSDPARHALINRMIVAGDLINRNVTSAMNSNIAFLRGMVDGEAYAMTEDDILNEIVSGREALEADTESWLGAFMVLAYSPLDEDDLARYVAYSESAAGLALNRGLFAGFDPLYEDISYALGRIVALNLTGEEL